MEYSRGIRGSISSSLSFAALGLALFAGLACLALLVLISPANVSGAIESIDITRILQSDEIVDEIVSRTSAYQIGERDVRALLNSPSARGAVQEIVKDYADAMYEGDYGYHLNKNDIINGVISLESEIYDRFGYKITDQDYEMMSDYLDSGADLRDYSLGAILSGSPENRFVSEQTASNFADRIPRLVRLLPYRGHLMAASALLCFLTLFNMCVLRNRRIREVLPNAGAPCVILGAILTAVGAFGASVTPVGASQTAPGASIGSTPIPPEVVAALIASAGELLRLGFYCLAGGSVPIIAYIIVNAALGSRKISFSKISKTVPRAALTITTAAVNALAMCSVALLLYDAFWTVFR